MPTAQLIVSQPGRQQRRVETSQKLISIGRKEDNLVALTGDQSVSRYHAVIKQQPDGFWLIHLSESSSTHVNDQPVQTTRLLAHGDLIRLGGSSTIEFVAPGARPAGDSAAPPADGDKAPAPPPTPALPADAPTAPAPAPPPPAPSGGFPLIAVFGVVAGLAVVALAAVLAFAYLRPGSGAQANNNTNAGAGTTTPTDAVGDDDTDSVDPEDLVADPVAAPPPGGSQAAPNGAHAGGAAAASGDPAAAAAGGATAAPGAVVQLSDKLAVQLGQRSGYRFDPQFARLIEANVSEYRAAAGFSERALKHRAAINDEFTNQGLPPLIGYVAAMSATKFRETGAGGVWGLPPEVVRASVTGGGAEAVNMNDPATGARVAALYMKELLERFGREHFMYAVACYGMPLEEVGRFIPELERKDPAEQLRYDFWRMKTEGLLKSEQINRVSRFFAAGVVGENPQAFGLKDKPLSTLLY